MLVKIQNFSPFDITALDKRGFIHSLKKFNIFSSYHMLHIAVGPGDAIRNETGKIPHSHATYILIEEREENPIKKREGEREKREMSQSMSSRTKEILSIK